MQYHRAVRGSYYYENMHAIRIFNVTRLRTNDLITTVGPAPAVSITAGSRARSYVCNVQGILENGIVQNSFHRGKKKKKHIYKCMTSCNVHIFIENG